MPHTLLSGTSCPTVPSSGNSILAVTSDARRRIVVENKEMRNTSIMHANRNVAGRGNLSAFDLDSGG
jgi:hypothetical protein